MSLGVAVATGVQGLEERIHDVLTRVRRRRPQPRERQVGDLFEYAIERPVTVRMEADQVYARADSKRVRQVLTNLVGNAIKFTHSGEVVVRVGRRDGWAHLSVRDTGPGISSRELAVIFQEYKQATEERARRRGTGLGLAIARRLVLLHGGRIEVDSQLTLLHVDA